MDFCSDIAPRRSYCIAVVRHLAWYYYNYQQ